MCARQDGPIDDRRLLASGESMCEPCLDSISQGVGLSTEYVPVISVPEQLLKLRLRLGLGPGAHLDLAALPIGGVSDIERREPALPRLFPVQATLARVTPRRHRQLP